MKFTQKIKDDWIEALESGKYKRCTGHLYEEKEGKEKYCCIGVLGKVTEGLDHNNFKINQSPRDDTSPYRFLNENFSQDTTKELWQLNDLDFGGELDGDGKLNDETYSCVLGFIKALKTN